MTNPVTEKLLALACEQTHLSPEEILAAVADPRWDESQKCHDWRNHIDEDLRPLWPLLSSDGKLTAFLFASDEASSEEWE